MPLPPKKFATVDGRRMAYVEQGEGPAILFLHGNPTSSYLWRNIMPHAVPFGRCIAPDLIGMGDSDKLPDSGPDRYRFVEHRHYLDGLIDKLCPDGRLAFVVHDWGSALGFDWSFRHPDRVRGIAYMEAIIGPRAWDDFRENARPIFEAFRSPAGEEMVLDKNVFVERVLPGSILRKLTDEEMAEYRRPFAEPGEGRRPTLTWPREIPLDGEPADVNAIAAAYGAWMAENDIPKLFVNAEPGAILTGKERGICRGWRNQTEVTVEGIHFIQEDSPGEIGTALASWLPTLPD